MHFDEQEKGIKYLAIVSSIAIFILGSIILFGPEYSVRAFASDHQTLVKSFASALEVPGTSNKLVLAMQQKDFSLPLDYSSKKKLIFSLPSKIGSDFLIDQGSKIITDCEDLVSTDCDQALKDLSARDELSQYESVAFVMAYVRRESIPIQDRLNFYQNWRRIKGVDVDDPDANELEEFLKAGGKRTFPIIEDER